MNSTGLAVFAWGASCALLLASGFIRLQQGISIRRNGFWVQEKVDPNLVLGNSRRMKGLSSPDFVLVEFGDYQCPICQSRWPEVEDLIQGPHRSIDFVFRNLPLSTVHPLARRAAEVATSYQGDAFWRTHRDLMSNGVSDTRLAAIARSRPSNDRPAESADRKPEDQLIDADVRAAKALNVVGTPTFFLVRRDGAVFRIGSMAEAAQLIDYQTQNF